MSYLLAYAGVMCFLVLLREWRQRATLERFLVADRRVGGAVGAMSIAASWIWAPAIFVSTRVGYEWGYSGLLWFVLPNMLALVLFAPLAAIVRARLPEGYSYVQSLRGMGGGFRGTQLTVQLIMQIVIFAIQISAGAELLATITGASYGWLVIGMGLTPFCYTFFSGLRTSVFTDAIQYAVIAGAVVALFVAFPGPAAASDPRTFAPLDRRLLLEFGISSAISLVVAIFADHQQWQRAFALRQHSLVRTYWLGAIMHGVVTFTLGTLGTLIYGSGFRFAGRLELVGIEFIRSAYTPVFVVVFVVMALCALISTLDAGLCAFSSLWMTERRSSSAPTLLRGRKLMFGLALAGISVALVRLPLLTLWFVAGTIRLATFVPTVASILSPNLSGRAGTTSIIGGLLIGGTLFGAGIYTGVPGLRTAGMIMSVASSGIILWGFHLILRAPRPVRIESVEAAQL